MPNTSRQGATTLSTNHFFTRDLKERVGSHYLLEVRLDLPELTEEQRTAITDELFNTYKSIKAKLGIS